jgi:hypothetical protein
MNEWNGSQGVFVPRIFADPKSKTTSTAGTTLQVPVVHDDNLLSDEDDEDDEDIESFTEAEIIVLILEGENLQYGEEGDLIEEEKNKLDDPVSMGTNTSPAMATGRFIQRGISGVNGKPSASRSKRVATVSFTLIQ